MISVRIIAKKPKLNFLPTDIEIRPFLNALQKFLYFNLAFQSSRSQYSVKETVQIIHMFL